MQTNPNYGRPVKFKINEVVKEAQGDGIFPVRGMVTYDGIFHEYLNDTALIELPSGQIKRPYIEDIQFIDNADTDEHPNNIHGH